MPGLVAAPGKAERHGRVRDEPAEQARQAHTAPCPREFHEEIPEKAAPVSLDSAAKPINLSMHNPFSLFMHVLLF